MVSNSRFLADTGPASSILGFLRNKRILVTGGTGSFGGAFARRLIETVPVERLVIFSRDELKQYEMEQTYSPTQASRLRFFLGDVRDLPRLEMAMRDIDIVIHAAALKQVPAAEYNPFECIHTNVLGAENVVRAALRNQVKRVIALSTDKASNPINLYGASKLASDKIFVAANHLSGSTKVRFSVVRYGNVMGSRGSVVPLFRKLIAEGADSLPITDANMTRFWITLREGVDFVLSCLEMMRGGEIFVPKIPSMKITDLATTMAPHLKHRIVGIRPGEKLHETMITEGDARSTMEMADRYVIEPAFAWWDRSTFEGPTAKRVADDFRYSSDSNPDWLKPDQLRTMLTDKD
jgi:UDP-N-acetylglucosamine 4,6-dehydratase/5-epimerase